MDSTIELVISPRDRDLGGFHVRRILPYASHRMVGPFIFLDHMGPAHFKNGEGMDVRPHPHIGLSTVTYLFEGNILHRDSLGSKQLIQPGDINWMVAGRGITHSERMPQESRIKGADLHGIQCWVALPKEFEETEPAFYHHAENSLPRFFSGKTELRLLAGTALGHTSPVKTYSDLIYVEAKIPSGESLYIPHENRELGIYIIDGEIQIDDQKFSESHMVVLKLGSDINLKAQKDSKILILGGERLEGERKIWWNFVSSSAERLEQAKQDWANKKFPLVPGDETEFIPLPEEPGHKPPPGTIL